MLHPLSTMRVFSSVDHGQKDEVVGWFQTGSLEIRIFEFPFEVWSEMLGWAEKSACAAGLGHSKFSFP